MEAELLCQESGFSGKIRGRIDKRACSRRDFRPAVPSAAFPGRLPATFETSLLRDTKPRRENDGTGVGGTQAAGEDPVCVHILAALRGETVGLGLRRH